jgi:hypothetical protein
MGKRGEPRKEVQVPVRIFGTDHTGAVFSQKAVTVNISRHGVELAGLQSILAVDEIIGLIYGTNRAHFRVKWVGAPGTARAPGTTERRKDPRYRCQNSIEIHVHTGPSFWGTVADLSLGGCYAELAIPMKVRTKLKVAIWFGEAKAWAEAEVAHRTPGFGVGIRFTHIAQQDLDVIQRFLDSLAPLARKPLIAAALRGTHM